jgi:hypothetical protein
MTRGLIVAVALLLGAAACGSKSAPTSPDTTPVVKFCGSLAGNTTYTLQQDLSQTSASPCLQVSMLGNVQLDCQGHSVSGIDIFGSARVVISNCTVTSSLSIDNSVDVTVTHSTLSGGLTMSNPASVTVDHSQIGASIGSVVAVQIAGGTNVALIANSIAMPSNNGNEAVYLTRGTGNQVLQNTITSAYVGTGRLGTDDGVLLQNESGDLIRDNTITGFWDTAVEGVDAISNVTVVNNTFSNIGTAAIGAYWCTDWTNNTIQGNDVSQSPKLALVEYETAAPQCGSTIAPPVFSGNQFIDNKLHDVIPGLGGLNSAKMRVTFDSGDVENNVLRGNDFGANDGPLLTPLTGFVDGGGNICGPTNASLSNFACSSTSGTQRQGLLARRIRR